MIRLIVGLVALAVAATGCTTMIVGTSRPNEQEARETSTPLTAKQELGDFGSVNYCSLLDAVPLPADIGSMIRPPTPAYEYCHFSARVSGTEIEFRVGYLANSDMIDGAQRTVDRSRTPPRGLTIQRGEEGDDGCVRFLRFTDDIWLTVAAQPESGKGDWCRAVDATVDTIIRRVLDRQTRHFSFAEKSVGRLEACELVPVNVINAKVGIKVIKTLRSPSRHECFWVGGDPTDPAVRLFLGAGESTADDNTKEEVLVDHRSYVTPFQPDDDDYSMCDVETDHIDSPDIGGKELVVVEVMMDGKGKDACAPARELAKEIWPKLPKP